MKLVNYKPDYLLEAVYNLDVENLKKKDIRAIMVDLDNTLIAWNNPDGTPELHQWLKTMRENGIKIIVVSNNNRERVQRAVAKFDVDFISRAMKPFAWGINKALIKLQERPDHVVMVGDQLMTDIRAAHRAGVRSILVKQLIASDGWSTKFNRWRERRVWRKLIRKYGPPEWKTRL